jgi:hypothetical protein
MALKDDLEAALLDTYTKTGKKAHYWAHYFRREIERRGALETAKRLLEPNQSAVESKGFLALRSAGRLDLSVEAVVLRSEFRPLFTKRELAEATRRLQWVGPRDMADITAELNLRAQGRPIGRLQKIRSQRNGTSLIRKVFDRRSTFDRYAYHVGGRTELQFNVGFETLDHQEVFRHGVAFSLEPSRNMPSIDVLIPKISRFSEYVRIHDDDLAEFRMWHFVNGEGDGEDYPAAPIAADLVRPGTFVFLGKRQPAANVDVDLILNDFDALVPLYEFVESNEVFPVVPSAVGTFTFVPGCTIKPSATRATIDARSVDIVLRHNDIQRALFDYINDLQPDEVATEVSTGNGTKVDLGRKRGNCYWFYEIKTALSARLCIREAIGQLIEYAFWPGGKEATALVIVAEATLDKSAELYLRELRSRFNIPLYYQQFDMANRRLVGNGPEHG